MEEKERLRNSIRSINGRDPKTMNEFLSVIVHPDVVADAKAYLHAKDNTEACRKYQPPWNCAKEAEAYTQTVHNGSWSGGLNDIIENWCVNCRAKLYGEDPGDIPEPLSKTWLEDPTEDLPSGKIVSDDLENPMVQRDIDGC